MKIFRYLEPQNAFRVFNILFIFAAFTYGAIRILKFIAMNAVNVMFYDEWDFLAPMFHDHPWYAMFLRQHGPHRQGLGGLLTEWLYESTHWNARYLAFAAGMILISTAIIYLWLAARLTKKLALWLGGIPIIVLTLRQWEYFLGAENLSHGPVPALIISMIALLLSFETLSTSLIAGLTILIFMATFTGFALFAAPVVIFVATLQALQKSESTSVKLRWAMVAASGVSSLSFFFHDYAFIPAMSCFKFPDDHPELYFKFASGLLGRATGIFSELSEIKQSFNLNWLLASLLFLCETATAAFVFKKLLCSTNPNDKGFYRSVFFLSTFSLCFQIFTAVGRVCGGLEGSWSSRYVAYSIPGVLGTAFLSTQLIPRYGRLVNIALTILVFGCIFLERNALNKEYDARSIYFYHVGKLRWADCYIASHDVSGCITKADFTIHPDPEASNLREKLRFLEEHRLNLYNDKGPSGFGTETP